MRAFAVAADADAALGNEVLPFGYSNDLYRQNDDIYFSTCYLTSQIDIIVLLKIEMLKAGRKKLGGTAKISLSSFLAFGRDEGDFFILAA